MAEKLNIFISKESSLNPNNIDNFEDKANLLHNLIENYSITTGSKIDVNCYTMENFPNDNRPINGVPIDITLMSLMLKVPLVYFWSNFYRLKKDLRDLLLLFTI